mmetsp:Transcript_47815/g.80325  ORF Transcript_47815/g.80325 Transcript_47815/m.80325 type:complete len:88 (-) Transcript_47815:23-286(-)
MLPEGDGAHHRVASHSGYTCAESWGVIYGKIGPADHRFELQEYFLKQELPESAEHITGLFMDHTHNPVPCQKGTDKASTTCKRARVR